MSDCPPIFAALVVAAAASGCASYRTDSNISNAEPPVSSTTPEPILIAEDALPGRKYKALGPIEVSIKKLTVFHRDPTKDQADEALSEKARTIGANAIINVRYQRGIGLTTWGYIDATGTGAKLID
jgi:hypothetical protein